VPEDGETQQAGRKDGDSEVVGDEGEGSEVL